MKTSKNRPVNEEFTTNVETLLDCICWECYSFKSLDHAYDYLFAGAFNDACFDNFSDLTPNG